MHPALHRTALLFIAIVATSNCCRRERAALSGSPQCKSILTEQGAAKRLLDARSGFETKLLRSLEDHEPLDIPPPEIFSLARYPTPNGPLPAYLSPNPGDGKRHPAMLWITGGLCNSIGSSAWEPADPANDQSAAGFREAGIVLMIPSLRGGNENPGRVEGFLGEVDDVIAASAYLRALPYVDPERVYLGGHSSGGTLALLVAEATDVFRGTFAFGPVSDVAGYGEDLVPAALDNPCETELRSPVWFLHGIRTPTYIIEGANTPGNAGAVHLLKAMISGGNVNTLLVNNANHFSVLGPATRVIAAKIAKEDNPKASVSLSKEELERALSE